MMDNKPMSREKFKELTQMKAQQYAKENNVSLLEATEAVLATLLEKMKQKNKEKIQPGNET